MREHKLDAVLVYTNHVRPAAVSFLTGFTPYWSDALLLLPSSGPVVFATALSNRVGSWIRANNPTAEVLHSPEPGKLIGERIATAGGAAIGVVELERMPRGLVAEIESAAKVTFIDASALFADVRAVPDAAEIALVQKADRIALAAFSEAPKQPVRAGDVTETLELSVRNAGAEECYVAVAPDLASDSRLIRVKGSVLLGESFAVRLSVAYNGVWIRRIETLARNGENLAGVEMRTGIDRLAEMLELDEPLGPQIAGCRLPAGVSMGKWSVEAPVGTRPLEPVAWAGHEAVSGLSYGVLTLNLQSEQTASVFARPVGVANPRLRTRSVA